MVRPLMSAGSALGATWLRRQRRRHRDAGAPLAAAMRRRLQPTFSDRTLDAVRLVDLSAMAQPRRVPHIAPIGLTMPLVFRFAAGITLDDTILLSPRVSAREGHLESLVFHEIVHVVQFSLLGIDEFMRRYLAGWAAAGFRYHEIPLERDAYALQALFDAGRVPPDVEAEIARRL